MPGEAGYLPRWSKSRRGARRSYRRNLEARCFGSTWEAAYRLDQGGGVLGSECVRFDRAPFQVRIRQSP